MLSNTLLKVLAFAAPLVSAAAFDMVQPQRRWEFACQSSDGAPYQSVLAAANALFLRGATVCSTKPKDGERSALLHDPIEYGGKTTYIEGWSLEPGKWAESHCDDVSKALYDIAEICSKDCEDKNSPDCLVAGTQAAGGNGYFIVKVSSVRGKPPVPEGN